MSSPRAWQTTVDDVGGKVVEIFFSNLSKQLPVTRRWTAANFFYVFINLVRARTS
jgi:hypothetical protein